MATLNAGTPLSAVARILHSAALLSHEAWNGGGTPSKCGSDGAEKPAPEPPPEPRLSDDLLQLFTLLKSREIRHVLVGGVAMLKYIDGRNTDDIDLLMSVESLAQLPEIQIEDRNPDFAKGRFHSVRVDLLLTSNPVFKLVQDKYATTHRFRELEVPCATVEGLILLKLFALPALYLAGDLQRVALYETDVTMLTQRYGTALRPLLNLLQQYVEPAQHQELQHIAAEIEQRVARMTRSSPR